MSKVRVADNLYKVERTSGTYYYLRIRRNGKLIERSLGNVEIVSLKEAKMQAARLLIEIDTAPDLTKDKTITVKEACEMALKDIARVKKWRNERSEAQWRSSLSAYVIPKIGNLSIGKIDRDDVLAVLLPIWEIKNETASRVRMRLEAVINWAIRHNYRKLANPAAWRGNLEFDLPPVAKVKRVKHHASMTLDEARQVVSFCIDHSSVVSAAILFGMATVSRVSEFRFAKWDEIQGDTWLIPPERRKDGKPYPHRVPLNHLALLALDMVKKGKAGELIFPSPNGKAIHLDTPRLKLVNILKKPVTMHGCRSTFSDWCAENGKSEVLREKSLMHATGNEVAQAYQRSDLLEQRRPLMQAWADALTKQKKSPERELRAFSKSLIRDRSKLLTQQ